MRKYKLNLSEILFLAILSLLLCHYCPAQTTSVTATVTDTDGQTWNNGSWSATLYNPFPANPPSINGVPLTASQLNLSGLMSNSGVITGTFSDNSFIAPTGTQWYITICPNANTQCSVGLTGISGTSANLSTLFSSYTKPIRIPASWNAYMYRDAEVFPNPIPGGRYWNVSSSELRCWSGISWNACTTGGVSGFPIILGTTTIAASSTNTEIDGLNVNGVTLQDGGPATQYLTKSGTYVTPNCADITNCLTTAPVTSVFGRTGTVTAQSGDYTCAQVTNCPSLPSGNIVATPVSNVSTSCPVGTCTNTRGEIQAVVSGGGTSGGNFITVAFSTTLSAVPFCTVTLNGSTSTVGIGHGAPSTTGFEIVTASAVSSSTLLIDYTCQP